MSDPISDLIIRLKNATLAHKNELVLPYSNYKLSILNVIKENGFIESIETKTIKNKKTLSVILGKKSISHIKQVSKPGQRIYVEHKQIPRPLRGFGLVVMSTPRGVLSGNTARKNNIGGELICEVW